MVYQTPRMIRNAMKPPDTVAPPQAIAVPAARLRDRWRVPAVSGFVAVAALSSSVALTGAGCAARAQGPASTSPATSSSTAGGGKATSSPASSPRAESRGDHATPSKPLTIDEARRYMVRLINRDRATAGLAPVELDTGAATQAGQAHAEDMARLGYLGHWGSDGSVPEQRHSEAGGASMVLENALCFTDEKRRTLDGKALIDPKEVERAESMFFNEVPPNDGHRKNILKPSHTKVGVGVAQPVSTETELAVPCFTHEFTDDYGSYQALPRAAKAGQNLHVEGTLRDGASPSGVGIAKLPPQKPLGPSELNKRRSYPVPKPAQMYWRAGFVTPVPVKVDGGHFSVDLSLPRESGLYEISVWAQLGGSKEHSMVSLRTLRVE